MKKWYILFRVNYFGLTFGTARWGGVHAWVFPVCAHAPGELQEATAIHVNSKVSLDELTSLRVFQWNRPEYSQGEKRSLINEVEMFFASLLRFFI